MTAKNWDRSSIHIRPAEIGDICVLLEPSDSAEIQQLRQRQAALKKDFGGSPINRIHLTCQRFAGQDERQITEFTDQLRKAGQDRVPFQLTALSLYTLYVPVRESNILKWNIAITKDLTRFVAQIEKTVRQSGIQPLYRTGFVSTLVAALKDIPEDLDPRFSSSYDEFPFSLFTASQMSLSRIDGPDQFEILATVPLRGGGSTK
jgi:2'-5' RNA ligase